jgi:predicted branched-subunit amino acid permease
MADVSPAPPGSSFPADHGMTAAPENPPPHVAFQVFLDGIGAAVRSVFFYVLVGNYVGMGALAHEVGFSFWWMALSTVLIWAAPAQVILLSTLNTASLWEVALAVTLTSVRFLPMVAALLPTMRRPGVRQRDLLLPMHLTAISVWVEGMRLLPLMPIERRIAFYNGLGIGLISGALIGGAIGFLLAARLPPLLAATLLFFTPMAILMSSARNARTLVDGLAFGLGLVVAPILAAQKIGLDLMWTGLIAGSIAYAVHRVREVKKANEKARQRKPTA